MEGDVLAAWQNGEASLNRCLASFSSLEMKLESLDHEGELFSSTNIRILVLFSELHCFELVKAFS